MLGSVGIHRRIAWLGGLMSTQKVISSTFGIDQAELSEYRYQPTRTKQAIYSIGDRYFACGNKTPQDEVGRDWMVETDQFFAKQSGTILWSSKVK
jgi:hypothetical protein